MDKSAMEPAVAAPVEAAATDPSPEYCEADADALVADDLINNAVTSPAAAAAEEDHPIPWDVLLASTLDPYPLYSSNPEDDFVPTYTETDRAPILDLISTHPQLSSLLGLPLTTYPAPLYMTWNTPPHQEPNPLANNPALTDEEKTALYRLQTQLITTFFTAITTKNSALVSLLLSHGLVSPDTPSNSGQTPLLAAIEAGSGEMVCTLIGLGARVNGYGAAKVTTTNPKSGYPTHHHAERTPLMAAAAAGNLALVKLLMEDFSADDAIIAPDGQLALRLAADAGHRDVVSYLPARRGGAWRRWKVQHQVAWRRVTRAAYKVGWFFKILLWHVPRFFVWSVPKHLIVKPLFKGCKFCWTNRHQFGGWCKRQAAALPGRAARAGKAVWRGVKKVPRAAWNVAKAVPKVAWNVAKAVPKALGRLLKRLWTMVAKIPGIMKALCVWVWESLKRVGQATAHVFLRVAAALHTAVAAVLDFFRNIKLRDVWNGVCEVVDAVVRGLPLALWKVVSGLGLFVAGTIVALFGCAGKLVLLLVQALWYVAKYVPRQLGEMVAAIWSSIAKGYHEILVWINPKH